MIFCSMLEKTFGILPRHDPPPRIHAGTTHMKMRLYSFAEIHWQIIEYLEEKMEASSKTRLEKCS